MVVKKTNPAVEQYKQQIMVLRNELNSKHVKREGADVQLILDQIAELNAKIEALTSKPKRVVPVSNAPIYVNRTQSGSKNRNRNRVSIGSL